ncbi:MCE family protein [Kibdelosporangium philippinense]|uniref:MCE family protein n=1 Tax=Kibdelosporangium philippinense TaxID=211113 RepID=UPI0036070098
MTTKLAVESLQHIGCGGEYRPDRLLVREPEQIISLADMSRGTLELLAKYAPSYACMLTAVADFKPRVDKAFANGGLKVKLKVVQDRASTPLAVTSRYTTPSQDRVVSGPRRRSSGGGIEPNSPADTGNAGRSDR